jgi:hypothetical protein
MSDAWDRIFTDDRLRRARSMLSAHEILLMIGHARDAERDQIIEWLGDENLTTNNICASLERNLHRPKPGAADFSDLFDTAIREFRQDRRGSR